MKISWKIVTFLGVFIFLASVCFAGGSQDVEIIPIEAAIEGTAWQSEVLNGRMCYRFIDESVYFFSNKGNTVYSGHYEIDDDSILLYS
jgi:hypothetical protein